jgi:CHASE3 domain sensor protein
VQESRASYLATGKPGYLDAYKSAALEVDVSMDRLVTQDHAVTNKLVRAEDLRELVHLKLSEIGQSLEAPHNTTGALDSDAEIARIGKLLGSLAQDESRDIVSEIEAARARAAFHREMMIALAAINVLFLAGVTFCAMQISKLYSLITMCAWSKRVQWGDKWVPLEEYMRKRFGIRISHGISQEEYDKWAVPEMSDPAFAEEESGPKEHVPPPKAAA